MNATALRDKQLLIFVEINKNCKLYPLRLF